MLQIVVVLVAAAHAALSIRLHGRLKKKQEEARLLDEERRSERAGRTRAERALRDLQLQLGTVDPTTISPSGNASDASVDLGDVAYPLRPIGVLRSCFMKRNGTPRQPLLVATARASLKMRGELKGSLEGLEGYTHCWILFIFHQNTDLQRLWQSKERQYDGVRSKIRVPRLNGARLGVFATRSPHRPNPIGLSIARIDAIDDKQGVLWLSGVDIVDGSPVLDVKPFVPFCDAVSHAMAPSWVSDVAPGGEPLEIRSVKWSDVGERAVKECWDARRGLSLYGQYDEFRAFVLDALSRDIRSVTQRVKVPHREKRDVALPSLQSPVVRTEDGIWHVELDGIGISYDVDEANNVIIKNAHVL